MRDEERDYEWPEEYLDAFTDWEQAYCDYCGSEVEEGEVKCPTCGMRVKD